MYNTLRKASANSPRDTVIRAVGRCGPAGSVKIASFTIGGQRYQAFEAWRSDAFNHTFSIFVECETQAEIDRLWEALGEGGKFEQCGWLKDRWGLSWQITPRALIDALADPDPAAAKRAFKAMMTMGKIDIAAIEAARRG